MQSADDFLGIKKPQQSADDFLGITAQPEQQSADEFLGTSPATANEFLGVKPTISDEVRSAIPDIVNQLRASFIQPPQQGAEFTSQQLQAAEGFQPPRIIPESTEQPEFQQAGAQRTMEAAGAVVKGVGQTATFAAAVANAAAGTVLGMPWDTLQPQWERVKELGDQAPIEEISNVLSAGMLIYGGYEGLKAVPKLYAMARNSNLLRKLTIPERGLATISDEQMFNIYKTAPDSVKKDMATYNPQVRSILLDPAKVQRFSAQEAAAPARAARPMAATLREAPVAPIETPLEAPGIPVLRPQGAVPAPAGGVPMAEAPVPAVAVNAEPLAAPSKYSDFMDKVARKNIMESQGQMILDDMADKNISPQEVAKEFYRDVYPQMPEKAKRYFSIPDVPESELARSIDFGDDVNYLEGADRGTVSLMKYALDKSKASPQIPEPPVVSAVAVNAEPLAAPAVGEVPAIKEQMFLKYGGRVYPVGSANEASAMWDQVRDTAMKEGVRPDAMSATPVIVNQTGKELGYISWNGRVWRGENPAGKAEGTYKRVEWVDEPGKASSAQMAERMKPDTDPTIRIYPSQAPLETPVEMPAEKQSLDLLPTFQGKSFRVDTGYTNPRGTSAFDVVNFEETELGNIDDFKHLTQTQKDELKKYSANDIVWVTKSKKAAARYSEGDMSQVNPEDVGGNAKIIAQDGDGGYLVLKNNVKVQPPSPVKSPFEQAPNIPASYVEAKKKPDGVVQLFFKGTTNEVFPGEKFKSTKEARDYFKAEKIKYQEAQVAKENTAKANELIASKEAQIKANEAKIARLQNEEIPQAQVPQETPQGQGPGVPVREGEVAAPDWKYVDAVKDPFYKYSWLEKIANSNKAEVTDTALSGVLDRIEKLETEVGSNAWGVAWDVAQNRAASPATKSRALALREQWMRPGREYPETIPPPAAKAQEPPKPPEPPAAPPAGKAPEPPQDPVERFRAALRNARSVRAKQEEMYTAERRGRFATSEAAFKAGGKGEQAYYSAIGKLKGEFEKKEFEAIRSQFPQEQVDELIKMVGDSPLSYMDQVTAIRGVVKMLNGIVPQNNELLKMRKVYGKGLIEELEQKRSVFKRGVDLALDLANIPRAIKSGLGDMSAGLRQGVFFITRPEWWKAWAPSFKSFWGFKKGWGEDFYNQLHKGFEQDPDYELMHDSGLNMTDLENPFNREETYQSNMAEKIPVIGRSIRASGRAYTSYLNKLRFDVWKSIVDNAKIGGIDMRENPKALKELSNFVNEGTGRGRLGVLEPAARILNALIWSPRLAASRLILMGRVFNPNTYTKLDPTVRKEYLKSLLGFIGVGTGIMGVAKMSGVEVGTDPTSAGFGKLIIGNTRIGVFSNFPQWPRMLTQILTKKYTSSITGKVVTLGEGYKPISRFDILTRAIESKESPMMAYFTKLLKQQDAEGNPTSVTKETADLFVPIILGDIVDLAKDNPKLLPLIAYSFAGGDVQTYGGDSLAGRVNNLRTEFKDKYNKEPKAGDVYNFYQTMRANPKDKELLDGKTIGQFRSSYSKYTIGKTGEIGSMASALLTGDEDFKVKTLRDYEDDLSKDDFSKLMIEVRKNHIVSREVIQKFYKAKRLNQ